MSVRSTFMVVAVWVLDDPELQQSDMVHTALMPLDQPRHCTIRYDTEIAHKKRTGPASLV